MIRTTQFKSSLKTDGSDRAACTHSVNGGTREKPPPLLVAPQASSGANCLTTGCALDLNNGACPSQLELTSAQGDVVACKSPCTVFNTDEYCWRGAYSNSSTCKPTDLSKVFKKACPRAYSYAFDDATSTFYCAGAQPLNNIITFCPSPAISPNPSPGGDGDSNSYYLPFVNGTMGYDGAMDVNSSGATTCIHVLRSQLIAGAVAVAVATTVWRLCHHF